MKRVIAFLLALFTLSVLLISCGEAPDDSGPVKKKKRSLTVQTSDTTAWHTGSATADFPDVTALLGDEIVYSYTVPMKTQALSRVLSEKRAGLSAELAKWKGIEMEGSSSDRSQMHVQIDSAGTLMMDADIYQDNEYMKMMGYISGDTMYFDYFDYGGYSFQNIQISTKDMDLDIPELNEMLRDRELILAVMTKYDAATLDSLGVKVYVTKDYSGGEVYRFELTKEYVINEARLFGGDSAEKTIAEANADFVSETLTVFFDKNGVPQTITETSVERVNNKDVTTDTQIRPFYDILLFNKYDYKVLN